MKLSSGLLCLAGVLALLVAVSCDNDSLPTVVSGPGFEVVITPNPIQGVDRYGAKEWDYTVSLINNSSEPLVVTGYTFLDTGLNKLYSDYADSRDPRWINKNGGPWRYAGTVLNPRGGFQYEAGIIRSPRRFRVGTQERTFYATRPDGSEVMATVVLQLN
jgi:hypothetical protein